MASPGKKNFPLRLDPALWEAVERLAAQELRSANAQIEYLLKEALARRGIRPQLGQPARRGRPPQAGPGSEEEPDSGDDAGS